jgi:hypothetical protein
MSRKILKHTLVYFIQGEITKRIKIGQTNCMVEERMRRLQACSPDNLILLGAYLGFEYSEIKLHNMFERFRLHGEWFSPANEITDFISKNCLSNTTAIYHAYQEIEKGNLSYKEALALGEEKLCKLSNDQYLNIVDRMYTYNGKNILNQKKIQLRPQRF